MLWIIGVLGLVAIIVLGVVLGRSRTHSREASSVPPKKSISEPGKTAFPSPSFFSNQANLRAVAASSNIVKREPTQAAAQGNELDEARKLMSRQAYDKAIPLLKQALAQAQETGKRQEIMTLLVEALVRTQDYVGAEALLKELGSGATSDEERAFAAVRLAQLYTLQKNYSAAEQALADVAFVRTNQVMRAQIQHAQMRIWQSQPGRLNEVASNLEERVKTDPSDRDSLELLGTIYLKVQRDYAKAKPVYEQMLAADPANPALQNTVIKICQETRDYDQARDIYEQYLVSHPAEADGIRFQIAALYLQSGKGDDAVAYAEQHLGGTNGTPNQLQLVARIYEHAGRLDDSIRLLQQAQTGTDTADKRIDLRFQQEDLLARQQKYTEAEQAIRRILADFGSDPAIKSRANQELFRLYQLQGKTGELSL